MTNPPLPAITAAAILQRMEEELGQCAAAAAGRWGELRAQARRVPAGDHRRLVLTGCGDSFYAGLSMRFVLERLGGLPVLAVPAMEAATFPGRLLDHDCLLVGISVSGKVERTLAAVARHRERGGGTLAVTAHADSDLGDQAESVIATGMRGTPGPVPGTANYLGSLLALLALGLELEERARGAPSLADGEVLAALAAVETGVLDDSRRLAPQVAQGLAPPFFVLGSGPDLGAASFGVAKFVEAAATVSVAQDLEEWAHEQYFATREGSTVVLVSSTPATAERAGRIARSAAALGAVPVTIGHATAAPGEIHWPLPAVAEGLSPLLAWVPLAMLALRYARERGRAPFGIDRPGRMRTVDADIYVARPRRA
jgi:glucosamine--fructose-6-phosphate aminotransferase (isomerizing)